LEAKAREDEIKYETNENDFVINSSEITISNIDRDSRYGEGVKKDNQYILYLQEDLFRVNQDSIKYSKNGMLSNNYFYTGVNRSNIIE